MVLLEGIELSTSPLPRVCSTTELQQLAAVMRKVSFLFCQLWKKEEFVFLFLFLAQGAESVFFGEAAAAFGIVWCYHRII